MQLALVDRLTEFLDRAHFIFHCPLYPPSGTLSQGHPRGRNTATWLTRKQRFREEWGPERIGTLPDPLHRLHALRREVLCQRLAQLKAHGRIPRVCLYTHVPTGVARASSLDEARTYAASEQWRIKNDQCVADRLAAAPIHRPGWRLVLRLIRAGDVDGVVVPTYDSISRHLDEYENQLGLVEHFGGFVALATPETGGPR
ncbi:recombinase family protein [Streptomyces sp. QH1-20]|uniref:recombinase family protein n=1 Tax=Streptomyces sp. QH1-20 TaxID=3240934 RepID=UPI0035136424